MQGLLPMACVATLHDARMLDERFRSLLEGASPAVLTTYRRDGTALASPVWFRLRGSALEVVIAEGDVKLTHLARRAECSLTVFEAVAPFRGVETRRAPELVVGDVTDPRLAIASRYLGAEAGARFAAKRKPTGTLVRLALDGARAWDLSAILPAD
jgi:hypothetical protein